MSIRNKPFLYQYQTCGNKIRHPFINNKKKYIENKNKNNKNIITRKMHSYALPFRPYLYTAFKPNYVYTLHDNSNNNNNNRPPQNPNNFWVIVTAISSIYFFSKKR